MRRLKVAVVFDQEILAGGGFQQALNAALVAKKLPATLAEVLFFTTNTSNCEKLKEKGLDAITIELSLVEKMLGEVRRNISNQRLFLAFKRIFKNSPLEAKFLAHDVDLIYFVSPCAWALDLESLNFLTTVWDLSHRDDLEFPEVRLNRASQTRDEAYKAILPRATAVLVDSSEGKRNVVRRYGIDDPRVVVMPFQAAVETRAIDSKTEKLNISRKYDLDVPYIYYPAQFWAHKNHTYLLEGLSVLESEFGRTVGAIFSGGDKGNMQHVRSRAKDLKILDRVRFPGFVPNEEVPHLYLQSLALVMPSYFGPTNLPPLEAFTLGVPVLYSNTNSAKEQVKNAALLMNLNDPRSMALHLESLLGEPSLRGQLVEAGWARLAELESIDRVEVLSNIVAEFRRRRMTWA